ncbi:MAG TPA: helix-turn-helix transcriptional regulator [Polyangiaceae bacterium]|nr:helix-turn-helix transcriptional regulator [Polyangiaceae bacterium]
MKRARPPLARDELRRADALLTTSDVAQLLRVHPKHVYRLLRRGLPGLRVGGEWRFSSADVLRWSVAARATVARKPTAERPTQAEGTQPRPDTLVGANGDVAIELLMARLKDSGRPLFGYVQTDRRGGLDLLKRDDVLAAGFHGAQIPRAVADQRLAFIHLVDRQVVLACRRGIRMRNLRQIGQFRLASRPETAGVRESFDEELRRRGIDPHAAHARAIVLPSHLEVVCALARGEADVGLASQAWADRVGLQSMPLFREPYGLLVRAKMLGDGRVIRLCETVQSAEFRRDLTAVRGYQAQQTGTIAYEPPTHGEARKRREAPKQGTPNDSKAPSEGAPKDRKNHKDGEVPKDGDVESDSTSRGAAP